MIILKEERQSELIVKKSRFIAIAKKCSSAQQVKTLVEETRKLHPQANHVVHAAVINQTQFSFSDDHEPKNTAGRPAFEVLKGSGISDICVLIVRYFGGTLLGTGGLVKAYGDSVKAVLDGIETEERVEKTEFRLTFSYDLYERIKLLFQKYNISELKESFETNVTLSGMIPAPEKELLSKEITELSSGKYSVV